MSSWREQTRHPLFRASALLLILSGAAKGLAFFKDIYIGWTFGAGAQLDMFYLALMVPAYVGSLVSSPISQAFIPVYLKQAEAGRGKMLRAVLWIMLAVLPLLAMLLVPLGIPILKYLSAPGTDLTGVFPLLSLLVWVFVFQITGSLLIAVAEAHKNFLFTLLHSFLLTLFTIIALFYRADIYSLAIGHTLSYVVFFLSMLLVVNKKYQAVFPMRLSKPEFLIFMQEYRWLLAGGFLLGSGFLIDQAIAARLRPGDLSALHFANRLIVALATLGTMALGTAALPYFSQWVGEGRSKYALRIANKMALYIALIAGAGTVIIILWSGPLVEFLYMRGNFSQENADLVASILRYYVVQLPFILMVTTWFRLFSAMGKNNRILKLSALHLTVNIVLTLWLSRLMGVEGIALATGLSFAITVLGILFYLRREQG
jgi:putative peptidoglycan lipid II flippase